MHLGRWWSARAAGQAWGLHLLKADDRKTPRSSVTAALLSCGARLSLRTSACFLLLKMGEKSQMWGKRPAQHSRMVPSCSYSWSSDKTELL